MRTLFAALSILATVGILAVGGSTIDADHTGDTYNCPGNTNPDAIVFDNQAEAQAHYQTHPDDQDNLDADDDGIACESSNPSNNVCPCDLTPISAASTETPVPPTATSAPPTPTSTTDVPPTVAPTTAPPTPTTAPSIPVQPPSTGDAGLR